MSATSGMVDRVAAGIPVDPGPAPADTAPGPRRRGPGGAVRWGLLAAAAVAAVALPWWGPRVLAPLDFFHVRRIEFDGVRHARVGELAALLAVDTVQSVWQPLPPLAERVAGHPMVAAAAVERRLPGTLAVHIRERVPVALAPHDGRLVPVDREGRVLPIAASATPMDLPVLAAADPALLRALDAMRRDAPALYARVSGARRAGPRELRFDLRGLTVRARPEVTVGRLLDILPVEADLARQGLRATELDLRFRDQVIARFP